MLSRTSTKNTSPSHSELANFIRLGVLVFLLLIITAVIFSINGYTQKKQKTEFALSSLAAIIAETSSVALANGSIDTAVKSLDLIKSTPNIRVASIYNATGQFLGSYPSSLTQAIPTRLLPTDIQQFINSDNKASTSNFSVFWLFLKNQPITNTIPIAPGFSQFLKNDTNNQLSLFRPLLNKNKLIGILQITTHFNPRLSFVSHLTLNAAMLTLFTLTLLLVGYFFSKRVIFAPLQNFKATLRTAYLEKSPISESNNAYINEIVSVYNQLLEDLDDRNRLLTLQSPVSKIDHTRQLEELTKQNLELQALSAKAIAAQFDAEKANRVKSEFLASLSHEIRMPMSALLGMADSLWQGDLNQEQRRTVQVMKQSSTVLLNLLNDITDFAKIESGDLSLSKTEFNCLKLIKESFQLLELDAKSKNLKYSLEIAAEIPNLLIGDSARLSQILINLINNAIKFTAQGEVKLRASLQNIDQKTIRLHCEVTDTGIGIGSEKLNAMFKVFSTNDSAMTRVFPGTGLGLAITKKLVQLMKGKIGVNSQAGIGSTFWFWIDLGISEIPIKPVKTQSNYRFNASLLVAEDYPANQLVVERFLEDLGCDVQLVNNGFEAVKALKNQHFDLVFMDCQMPFMDGYQAAQEIRRNEITNGITKRTPIIALTAHALNEDEIKCKSAGMDEWVTKPFTRHDLSKILHKWLPKELILTDQPALKTDVKTLAKASSLLDETHAINMKFFTQQFKLDNIDDITFINVLTNAFQENAAKTLSNMQHSIDNADAEGIRKQAHGLKSLSMNVGSGRLAELCTAMEQTGKSKAIEHAQELLDSMKQEYLRVLTELNSLCAKV